MAKSNEFKLSLSKSTVWYGHDQTPVPAGTFDRLTDEKTASPSINLRNIGGRNVSFPKDDLLFFIDHSLVAVKDHFDKPMTDPAVCNWRESTGEVHQNESPYIPNTQEPKQPKTENLPDTEISSVQNLPEIDIITAQRLRRSGIQAIVFQNRGIQTPYSTTEILSMVINRTEGRTTMISPGVDNQTSFQTRDNKKIEEIKTVSKNTDTNQFD